MTRARTVGFDHARAVRYSLVSDQTRNGTASSSDHCHVAREATLKSSPVNVVLRASRAEYPTITSGGAGVARALRRSTAYGRRTDQRSDVGTTCTVTTIVAQSTATAAATVGTPARNEAMTSVTAEAASRISSRTTARD